MTHSPGDTIAAVATAPGGALSLIRISGNMAPAVCDAIFVSPSGRTLSAQGGNTLLYGSIVDENGNFVDDVVVSVFRSPHSYTGEDSVEISCHGSRFIVSEILRLLIGQGVRAADAGEFTSRAFLAGKIDLSQAEAVADMISSHGRASHAIAATQMRGGYSDELRGLREKLLRLASLLELELDFSDEEVTFADRGELGSLLEKLRNRTSRFISSFTLGNAIKEGIPVAIIGSPNAGKSTLLNALVKEDRAMVSDIAGTTRDVIEERVNIGGMEFRFIDTAGIRESVDKLERMGIERTYKAIAGATVILLLFDSTTVVTPDEVVSAAKSLQLSDGQHLCVVLNKCDETDCTELEKELVSSGLKVISISAKYGTNIDAIERFLGSVVDSAPAFNGEAVVSNSRHYEALLRSDEALKRAHDGLRSGLPSDLVAQDVRESLHWTGTITGEITTDEILGEIFSKFCIGK